MDRNLRLRIAATLALAFIDCAYLKPEFRQSRVIAAYTSIATPYSDSGLSIILRSFSETPSTYNIGMVRIQASLNG